MKPTTLSNIYGETRDAKKIIVVHLGFLGDSLHLIPPLAEIKRHYPRAELHVLSSPLGCEVIRMAPCVDHAWSVDLERSRRTWRGQWALIRALRREKFDLAINFSGSDRTIILTALTGARVRVAHAAGRHHFWNRWVIAHWVPKQDPDQIMSEQFRGMLATCGFQLEPPRLDLKLDDHAVAWAGQHVPWGALHVSVNSANPLKEWSVEHYIDLLKKLWLRQPDLPVVASAGDRERERARLRAVASGLNDSRLRLLPEDLTIAQLAGVLTRCRLHVGPDSGTMHLAVAL
ncbi:MAG: glycosyltransferase family 9 protein, partial [Opitutaceae bacterium]|nr:glycosyltransferase family 9 protein [Verrucomicrobiales bacterium]